VSQSSDGNDPAALRARFDAEILAADLTVPEADREHLFAMWADHLPLRDSLRAASVALEEEPSFTQKPAQLGAGVALTSDNRGGASSAAPARPTRCPVSRPPTRSPTST
jgi:hypothetical protein